MAYWQLVYKFELRIFDDLKRKNKKRDSFLKNILWLTANTARIKSIEGLSMFVMSPNFFFFFASSKIMFFLKWTDGTFDSRFKKISVILRRPPGRILGNLTASFLVYQWQTHLSVICSLFYCRS